MKCIKTYRRAGNTYVVGREYDIESAAMDKHEAYLGLTLWARSKSQEAASDAQTEAPADDADASTDDATGDDASKDDSSDDSSDEGDEKPKKRRRLGRNK